MTPAGHPQDLSLTEQARAIASGELDATELLEATLARIEERNPAINAIVDVAANEAARMLTEAPEGPLHGVPVAIKDQFALPWRAPRDGCAENMFGVGAGESAVFRRLRDAGALVVGVTNMHELGIGSTGHISAYGPVGTPWNPSHCGGGSSGGSAAAVGARIVAGAIGTDGGGSIRFPSAYCGTTGLKLTFGRMPAEGYIHSPSTLSAGGPICRDAEDARLLAAAMLGTSLREGRAQGLRVGVPETLWQDLSADVAASCREALRALADAGLEQGEVELEGVEHARIATVTILSVETSAWEQPEAARRAVASLSPLVRGLTKFGYLIPAKAYARSQLVRAWLRRSLAEAFARYDVLAWPTAPAPAPPIENPSVTLPSGTHPADFGNVGLGGIANLAGTPAISVPCGFSSDGLPIGLQLLAPWGEDERLLDVAHAFERATDRRYVDALPPVAQQAAV